jgi:RNA 2',3'-cyclic 3'-phosphodiesterase
MRTFIAIPLPEHIHHQLADIIDKLREPGNQAIRWVAPQNIHLTLKFLGEIPPQKTRDVSRVLEEIAAQTHPFTLEIQRTGCFPNMKSPRVLWVGVSQLEDLKVVHEKLERKLESLDFQMENRPFSPHLTLGRVNERALPTDLIKTVEKIRALQNLSLGDVNVDQMTLFKSDLTPKGSIYSPLLTVHFLKLSDQGR